MKHNSMVIGLTGQTGAGKSTLAEYAEKKGFAVINADAVAREALEPGTECLRDLAEHFGYDIIDENGCCNRAVLAQRAFSSAEETEALNRLTHPWIIRRSEEYISQLCHNNNDMIILDASQLFESGGERLCDAVIAVTAPREIRLERIMLRDNIDCNAAMLRINAQHDEEYYAGRSDYVIDGSADIQSVCESFDRILGKLCADPGAKR